MNIENRDKPEWDFIDVYRIIAELNKAQKFGDQLTSAQLKRRGVKIPHLLINRILELLKRNNWVHRTNNGRWILSRDLNEVTLYDLLKILPCKFPESITVDQDYLQGLERIIAVYDEATKETMNIPLSKVIKNEY